MAQPVELVGARALGMAGAFAAVADDATAAYWNPAGLLVGPLGSAVVGRDLTGERELIDGAGDRRHRATMIALGTPTTGLAYYRLTVESVAPAGAVRSGEGTLGRVLVTQQAALVLAHAVTAPVLVGAAVKLVRGRLGEESEGAGPEAEGTAGKARHVVDVDLGLLLRLGPTRLGLVVRNLREPAFEAPSGAEVRLARQVRTGVAVQAASRLTVAADLDLVARSATPRRAAAGAELWLGARAAVRGGLRMALAESRGRPVATGGASLALTRTVWLDGHWQDGRDGDPASWGWAVRLGF